MNEKLRVGILGGTGMVGQRFISLLEDHPWFEVRVIAAQRHSKELRYEDTVSGLWNIEKAKPEGGKGIKIMNAREGQGEAT